MDHNTYRRESKRLLKVLQDAVSRRDYYLEMDVRELLKNLEEISHQEDEE